MIHATSRHMNDTPIDHIKEKRDTYFGAEMRARVRLAMTQEDALRYRVSRDVSDEEHAHMCFMVAIELSCVLVLLGAETEESADAARRAAYAKARIEYAVELRQRTQESAA